MLFGNSNDFDDSCTLRVIVTKSKVFPFYLTSTIMWQSLKYECVCLFVCCSFFRCFRRHHRNRQRRKPLMSLYLAASTNTIVFCFFLFPFFFFIIILFSMCVTFKTRILKWGKQKKQFWTKSNKSIFIIWRIVKKRR